jgi:gas vesicle protein
MAEIKGGGGGSFWMFLTGAAVGAAVALLTAPKSGSETRRLLNRTMRGSYGRVAGLPTAVTRAAAEAGRAARETFLAEYERQAALTEDAEA